MDEEIFGEGWKHLSKSKILPKRKKHTDIKMSCLGTVVCALTRTSIKMKWLELLTLNRPFRYCYILAPESVLHIPVDYYLSVHNSGKIYLQYHH